MLTNNYYKMRGFFDSHTNKCDGTAYGVPAADITVIDIDGTSRSNLSYISNTNAGYAAGANSNYSMKQYIYPVLGLSNIEPTLNDYHLRDQVDLNLTTTMNSVGADGVVTTKFVITGTNTTGAEITIREIGIVKIISVLSEGSNPMPYDPAEDNPYNRQPRVLLDRSLLKTPKTVAANESFSLTFDWQEM